MTGPSILWRRLDLPGHESARLVYADPHWRLEGTALFSHEHRACRLDYRILCSSAWETLSARVTGWVGDEPVEIDVAVDPFRNWQLNGVPAPEVAGCIDIDLNFSPSTNLLPIRRLGLADGEEQGVRAAWLRFPGFRLEPLEQTYRRIGPAAYRYTSAGGRFVRDLRVDTAGFVTRYPGLWQAEPPDLPISHPSTPQASRPSMPGYGLLGAQEGAGLLPWSWAAGRLAESLSYWVVSQRPGGGPHAMPVWGVWLDETFYFSTGERSRKARNLETDPRCTVCAERTDEAVIVEGAARRVGDPLELKRFAEAYNHKYDWNFAPAPGGVQDGYGNTGRVFAVTPGVVFGFGQDLAGSATRWRFGP
jgi:hypothetical protein